MIRLMIRLTLDSSKIKRSYRNKHYMHNKIIKFMNKKFKVRNIYKIYVQI